MQLSVTNTIACVDDTRKIFLLYAKSYVLSIADIYISVVFTNCLRVHEQIKNSWHKICSCKRGLYSHQSLTYLMLYVNNGFECFMNTSAKRECFIVFECLVPLMKHEKRVVYTTSQTKTFHWLFNLLSANGGPMKVICFCLCEHWR